MMKMDYVKTLLPSNWRYEIEKITCEKDETMDIVIRLPCKDKEDFMQWKTDFEKSSLTNWIVRTTIPDCQKAVFRQNYICHHSTFNKLDVNKRKFGKNRSKNTSCTAILHVKVSKLCIHHFTPINIYVYLRIFSCFYLVFTFTLILVLCCIFV